MPGGLSAVSFARGGMEFRILGPLEVADGERLRPLGGAKQRALLAILALNANRVVSVDRILDALWGEHQPASGPKAIHVYVSQLRKLLAEDRVITQPPGYLLRVADDELDELCAPAPRCSDAWPCSGAAVWCWAAVCVCCVCACWVA